MKTSYPFITPVITRGVMLKKEVWERIRKN